MLLPLKGRHSDDEAGMSETGLWVPQQKPVLSQPLNLKSVLERETLVHPL